MNDYPISDLTLNYIIYIYITLTSKETLINEHLFYCVGHFVSSIM